MSKKRSWQSIAKRTLRPDTVGGDGPWAFVHYHHISGRRGRHKKYTTVILFETEEQARAVQYRVPCSGTCWGHSTMMLELAQ
jgi:hypothetical protein